MLLSNFKANVYIFQINAAKQTKERGLPFDPIDCIECATIEIQDGIVKLSYNTESYTVSQTAKITPHNLNPDPIELVEKI